MRASPDPRFKTCLGSRARVHGKGQGGGGGGGILEREEKREWEGGNRSEDGGGQEVMTLDI